MKLTLELLFALYTSAPSLLLGMISKDTNSNQTLWMSSTGLTTALVTVATLRLLIAVQGAGFKKTVIGPKILKPRKYFFYSYNVLTQLVSSVHGQFNIFPLFRNNKFIFTKWPLRPTKCLFSLLTKKSQHLVFLSRTGNSIVYVLRNINMWRIEENITFEK